MARGSFTMIPTKSYVLRYLLMIVAPPNLILLIHLLLAEYTVLSPNYVVSQVIVGFSIGYMIVAVCYFLVKKQCTLDIKNHAIKVTNIFGKTITTVKAKQIQFARRNFLDELKLYGEDGAVLITVCPHLDNRYVFEDWLLDHDIRLKAKPRRRLKN